MTQVALDARYSSDNQREASVEDQLRLCRQYAERQGWTVVDSYHDRAISGASLVRPGIQMLMQDAQRGGFDILLAEALDRISRDQEDVAGVYKRMTFAGVKIVTLSEGEITHLHVGLKGTMNALFLKDLADKTRRGLRGRIEEGKSGGGLCYGYDVVKRLDGNGEPLRGERAINEVEAAIVCRIFQEFADGKSPRAIARSLNAEGIPGPRGDTWMDTTIRGHFERGTGIINNELYVGRLVWNRLRYIKEPDSGRRVSRLNPQSEWIVQEVPDLRIVDDVLWDRVKQRQAELAKEFQASIESVRRHHANRLNGLHRNRHLLSGLLTCGVCGGNYAILLNDRYGCSNRYRRGSCSNGHTIRRKEIEARVLEGLKHKLVAPEVAAEAIRAFQEETNRLNRERLASAEADRQALAKVERGIKGILTAIEEGLFEPSMKVRLPELERQKIELEARLANAPEALPAVHPGIAEIYRAKIARLAEALADPEAGRQASEAIRSLVGKVVLMPGAKRGQVQAALHGELGAILHLLAQKRNSLTPGSGVRLSVVAGSYAGAENENPASSSEAGFVDHGVWSSVVAGRGFEPLTFRL
jgi:site-specific DNA recombinase